MKTIYMSSFDLNIENYNIEDIEKFLQLQDGYNQQDIDLKAYEMRTLLLSSNLVDKNMVRDIIVFISAAKQWLLFTKFGQTSLEVPDSSPLMPVKQQQQNMTPLINPIQNPNRNDEILNRPVKSYMYTNNSEFFEGNLNPLNNRIIEKCLNIDTKFRDNYDKTQSSDFSIQLPSKINKVVSMELSSIELPNCFYNISSYNGNNFLYIFMKIGEEKQEKILFLDDGIYNACMLIEKINKLLLNCQDDFQYLEFSIDINDEGLGTGKTIIKSNNDNISVFGMDFELGSNGQRDLVNYKTKIGYVLGFTELYYECIHMIVSNSIINVKPFRTIYLVVEDYQKSVNNLYLSAFENHIHENTISRIHIKNEEFTYLMENSSNLLCEPRRYFGPVDLQRLKIQLYDEYGRIISMNNSDFSFVLKLKIMYDL